MAKTAAGFRMLHRFSKKDQLEIFAGIDRLLKREGVAGTVSELHVELARPAAPAKSAMLGAGGAGPGPAVTKSTCRKLPNGQVVCSGG